MAETSPNIEKQTTAMTIKDHRWRFVRFFVVTILLLAAGMKSHQLATVPTLGEGLLHARWFNILVVEFELFFGIWLIFGMLPKLTWLATIGCFSVFATVSSYKAISGEASCGCFGEVTIPPLVMMIFDLFVVGFLVWFRPKLEGGLSISSLFKTVPHRELALFVGLCVISGGVVYGWIAKMRFEQLGEVGQVLKGNVVQLEPDTWVGKEFPLRDYVLDGEELTRGKWFVLLARPGCDDCKTIKRHAIENRDNEKIPVAILEISGVNPSFNSEEKTTPNFRLVAEIDWIVETPVVLILNDGVVRNVQMRKQLLSPKNESSFLFGAM